MKMIGTTEDLIKANRKASREAEKEARGGQLAYQHKTVTKNKKTRARQSDRYDRKGKHKNSLPFLLSSRRVQFVYNRSDWHTIIR